MLGAWWVPSVATLGLLLHFNSDASLPLVGAFVAGEASPGAALAAGWLGNLLL